MVQNLISVGLLAFGGYVFYSGQSGMTPIDLAKGVSSVGGAIYLLYSGNKDNLSTMFNPFINRPKPPQVTPSENVFQPKDYEIMDLNCLIHLRNRVIEAGSQEGLDTCAKLNDIVFSLNKKARQNTSTELKAAGTV